jgi:hypothetical protein
MNQSSGRALLSLALPRVNERGGNQGNQDLVVSDQGDSFTVGAGDRPAHDVGLRAIHPQEIDVDRSEPGE